MGERHDPRALKAHAEKDCVQTTRCLSADAMVTGGAFIRNVIEAFAYQIRTVPTDNGIAFTKTAPAR